MVDFGEFRGVEYYQSKTNGCVFDRDLNLLTEIDYPDLYYYDLEAAEWVVTFIQEVGTITEDGHHFKLGDPVQLLDWQIQTICNLFGMKRHENGLRRYWDVLHLLPKKQGKSPFSAFISVFLLCGDGQGVAEIISLACDKTQAGIIHKNAKKMIEASEILMQSMIVRMDYVEHTPTGSKFHVRSADLDGSHGPNLSGVMYDEPHAYPSWQIVENTEQGIAARPEPVKVFSSTAGVRNSPFHLKKYIPAKRLLKGETRNDTELVFIYETDAEYWKGIYGDRWGDDGSKPWWAQEEVWANCAPSYGITVTATYMLNEVTKVRLGTRDLNKFLQMHLNIFTGVTSSWSILEKWNHLPSWEDMPGRGTKCYAGLYVGKPQDATAFSLYFPDAGLLAVRMLMTSVESYRLGELDANWGHWHDRGLYKLIEGNYIGIDEHFSEFKAWASKYKIINVGYRSGDEGVAVKICEELKLKQRRISMKGGIDSVNATRHFEEMVNAEKILRPDNNYLTYQIESTEILIKDDNRRPSVQHSMANISGVMAMLLAIHGDYDMKESSSANRSTGIISMPNLF